MNKHELYHNHNYVYLLTSNIINRCGDSLDTILFTWLVYLLTNSAGWSAIIFGINQATSVIIQPFIGPLVENMNKKKERQIEQKVKESLEKEGLLCEIPDLLGCDLNYYSSGIELKSYRSEEQTYFRIRECLRAEILDDGEITMECLSLLWLLRESGCIHDLFSATEQERVLERVNGMAAENEYCRILWEKEFHSIFESFTGRFLRAKSKLFENPYLEGVSLAFPYLERRKAIFIDCVVFGTNVEERRSAAVDFLRKMGHNVEEVRSGSETLLKIDGMYYRIFPATRRSYKVPIQGVNLVPVYW